jgi:hypothetical protein
MKKLLVAGGAVLALCAVVIVIASFFLGSMVTAGVNAYAPRITGTRVTLGGASISPLTGSGSLRGLVVGNPAGWSDAALVSLGRVHVAIDPTSLFGDHVVIEDIDVEAPEFDYETKILSSNVGDLLATIDRASESGAGTAKAKNKAPMRFEVRHFRVTDGVVRLGAGKASVRVPLPTIELSDLGTNGQGLTSPQLAAAIARTLASDIMQAGARAAEQGAATAGAAAAQAVKGAGSRVKSLFAKPK